MALAKKTTGSKKRRTREHVIADMSINHIERQASLCGYAVERWVHDYGIDLIDVPLDRDSGGLHHLLPPVRRSPGFEREQ